MPPYNESNTPIVTCENQTSFLYDLLKLNDMLYITSDKLVRDIQQEFSQAFPFLKLEFFTKKAAVKKRISNDQFLSIENVPGKQGAECKKLFLTPGLTIKELAKTCDELFGVSVSVYRRFSNLWLETSITENFTLQQQNDHTSEIAAMGIQ